VRHVIKRVKVDDIRQKCDEVSLNNCDKSLHTQVANSINNIHK